MYLVGVDLEGRNKGPSIWIEWVEAALGGIINKEFPAVFYISPIAPWPQLIIDSQWRKRTRYDLTWDEKRGWREILWVGGGREGSAFTYRCRSWALFSPVLYYTLPSQVGSYTIEWGEFRFLGFEEIAHVLEAYYVAFFGVPSFREFGCASRRDEVHPIRSIRPKIE